MSVCPTNFDEKVECPFVDRKEFIEAFEKAFQNIDLKDYSILVYYGVAGIGKTSLRKELPTLLKKRNKSDRRMKIIWTSIDFATEQYRQPYKFLEVLSSQLRQEYGIKFNSFEIALATYWKKVNPHVPLVKENYSEESIVRDVLDICDEFVPANLILNVFNLARSLPECYQEWALKREKEISKLPYLEPTEIDELLPVYWAYDLADHLQNTSESAVIFIDTYEALWEKERDIGSFNDRDKWLRKLIGNIQRSCLWVICGREALRWEEVDEDWKNYLDQHILGKLPEEDSINLLEQCGITEKEIQKILIESSEGVPYYLELSIDTYRKIKRKKQPAPEDFAKVPDGIFCRFVRYLDREEKDTLKVLSVPRYWDRELFEILIEKFNTGYPATNFSELHSFSFMDIDEKEKCSMHQLMRKSLQVYQDQDLKKKVHNFMLDFYSNQLKNLDIKSITPEHEAALTEAFYHAKEALETEDLFEWYINASDPFKRAAFWQLIAPMYEEILRILEVKLGSENPRVAETLNELALLYYYMRHYEKALPLYQRSFEIFENWLVFYQKKGLETPSRLNTEFATLLNNFALFYSQIRDYEKALPLYQSALEIAEKELGHQHQSFATILDNLAGLYLNMGDYEKALPLYKRSLEIFENCSLLFRKKGLATPDQLHIDIANSLNNLATLYSDMGNYKKALPLYQSVLEIAEKKLGDQHPYFATSLYNLFTLYFDMGNYEKAFPLSQKWLEIAEKKRGQNHLDIAIVQNNLAGFYFHIGDYDKALSLSQKVLDIREEVLGPEHLDVANSLSDLAALYESMKNYEKALPLYKKALEISEKKLGQNNPITMAIKDNYNGLLSKMSENEKK